MQTYNIKPQTICGMIFFYIFTQKKWRFQDPHIKDIKSLILY
jgi:hypothetical protein